MPISLTPAGHTPRVPRVYFPGGLTPRQHAIVQARKWQLSNVPTDGIQSPAYAAIVGLLATFPADVLFAAYRKAGIV